MKKVISLLLLTLLPLLASAADAVKIDGVYYTLIAKAKKAQVTSGAEKYTGNVTIPSTVVYNDVTYDVVAIEDNAFNSCKELTSVTVPGSVKTIGKWAFAYCSTLTTAVIADGVTSMDEHVFHGCEALMSLDIPNSVTSIGNIAFAGCKSLTSIKLPDGITVIRQSSFQNCTSLPAITIPAKVKEIELGVFNGCTGLTTVTIPEGVTTLGNQLFKDCTGLATVVLPNSVTNMGNGLFNGCSALTNVTLPNGITDIEYDTFRGCTSLTTVNIPASVTTLGEFAFNGCKGLTSIQLHNGLKTIESGVFYECEKLTTMNLPSSLTSLGGKAFMKCTGLTSVTIPEGITAIPSECFKGCTALTAITIPNSVKEISDYAFQNCTAATSLTIGSGTKQIWNYAFAGCSSLKEVTIPDNVTETGSQVFRECSGITSLTIGTGLTELPNGMFRGCSSLTEVTIPNQLQVIMTEVFYQCTNLKDVVLGSGLRNISALAFASCENLENVYCYAKEPPTAWDKSVESSYTFKDSYVEYAKLHVPAASIDAYKAKAPWSYFGEFIALAEPEYTLTYYVDGKVYKTYQLKEGAAITAETAPTKEGYTFSGWSEIPETMPAHDVTVTGTFSINKYLLTYLVDGAEYKKYELEYGAAITSEAEPTKEGYTFSGWSDIPKTMPAHDVTVTGTFTANKYKLTYLVDGETYKTYELEYGAKITPEAEPEKEGYVFSGWSEIPPTMPAKDVVVTGTFTKGAYKLTYVVDGEVYKTVSYDYGTAITPEPAPTKEGYTFSGWNDLPQTMPAHDVTVTGTFTANKYKLTYLVDGETYKTYELEYGAKITPEAEPEKEGYVFSGWSEIPPTMPAKDVVVTGTFTKGAYKLTYVVDGEVYKTVSYDYGTAITPEPAPTKEGYTFSGWNDLPQTMPAYDVRVTGTFTINSYKLTYMIDDKVYKEIMYEYGATITPEPQPEGDYQTFEWVGLPDKMPAHDVTVTASYVTGIADISSQQVEQRVYGMSGASRNKLKKGLNIVVNSNGKVRKVVTR